MSRTKSNGVKEFLKEFAVSIIFVLIPVVGFVILRFIVPGNWLSKFSSEEQLWLGGFATLIGLFFISSIIMLISRIRNKIKLNKSPIGKTVCVVVDRPLGSFHPNYKELYYSVNYGYVKGIIAGDGEEQDAYILGIYKPINEFTGIVVAVIHRLNDNEDKWVVVPEGFTISREEIMNLVEFQERYFEIEILMN